MTKMLIALACVAAAAFTSPGAGSAGGVPHHPLYMPDAHNVGNPALQPPPICCLPGPPVAAGAPYPGNMAYFGGHVQVTPKVYLVFWGWGEPEAFDHLTPGMPTYDPDGAAQLMTSFTKAMGGTAWAGVSTQYYETVAGQNVYIQNPTNVFAGAWYDDTNLIHDNVTGLELARGAAGGRALRRHRPEERAVRDRPAAEVQRGGLQLGCRLLRVARLHAAAVLPRGPARDLVHEHALRPQPGHGLRPELRQLRLLHRSARRLHDRDGPRGRGDDHRPRRRGRDRRADLGGWYDMSAWENADKCAWVGYSEGIAPASTVPGGLNDITGNDGKQYAVQSLWSNDSAAGAGYCAGADDDLPLTG